MCSDSKNEHNNAQYLLSILTLKNETRTCDARQVHDKKYHFFRWFNLVNKIPFWCIFQNREHCNIHRLNKKTIICQQIKMLFFNVLKVERQKHEKYKVLRHNSC